MHSPVPARLRHRSQVTVLSILALVFAMPGTAGAATGGGSIAGSPQPAARAVTGNAGAPALAHGSPARYRYTTVALPGYPEVVLAGISDSGAYAGEACPDPACTRVRFFVATPAGRTTFYTLPFANYSPAGLTGTAGMDNAGDVTGFYSDNAGSFHGYLRTASGLLTQINDPLAAHFRYGGTEPQNISADGSVIVGAYYGSAKTEQGFLLHGGRFTTYDVPGAAATEVDFYYEGEFGGTYISADGTYRGFYVIHGKLHTLSGPVQHPGKEGGAELAAVDASGTVFGFEFSATKAAYSFSYANGRYTIFRDPDEVGTTSSAGTLIQNANLNGAVAGIYTYTPGNAKHPGKEEGFIARPDSTQTTKPTPRRT